MLLARMAGLAAMLSAPFWIAAAPRSALPLRQPPPSVMALRWLVGCWRLQSGAKVVEEQWMAPRGHMMLGMSRTVRGDSTTSHESLVLREEQQTLIYHATPSAHVPAAFRLIQLGDSSVSFETDTVAFPHRIRYRRTGVDSLIARTEGTIDGAARSVEFAYAQAGCGPE